ncbi:winged helix-turn-helix transcriptional regulator [Nocardiopsis flavescens]|uniref:winged helix-turn-helix transcriptional regulator n=1 Tax=Nocardiopsis flavescens TaxID=758803 RepID=UPI0036648F13
MARRPGARHCGIDAAMGVIGGRWKVLVLWALDARPHRFGELRRALEGVSEKVLADHLREMQDDGLVHREDFGEVPPRVEYSLTPLGRSLNEALEPLGAWGQEHALDTAPDAAAAGEGDAPATGRPRAARAPARP